MRLFLAVPLPDTLTGDVARACAIARASVPGGRWVSAAHMHLTMKFLGERPDHDPSRIADVSRAAMTSVMPFHATLGGVGAFPNFSRPRVVWLGMEPSAPFVSIAALLDRALAPLGYPVESRPFTAHLTLGRVDHRPGRPQRAALVDALLHAFGARSPHAPLHVRELALIRSDLARGAARYDTLHSIPLGVS